MMPPVSVYTRNRYRCCWGMTSSVSVYTRNRYRCCWGMTPSVNVYTRKRFSAMDRRGDEGDYRTRCRQFIEDFSSKIDGLSLDECQTPFRLVTFYLVSAELEGECLEWIRRYLSFHDCPTGLATQLSRAVYKNFEDSVNLSSFYLEPDDKRSDDSDEDEVDGNLSQGSSDEDLVHHASPQQLDAVRLLPTLVSYIHATVKSWNISLPMLSAPLTNLRVSSHAIKNTRRKMEDRHVVIPDLNLLFDLKDDSPNQSYFAVFDGHGGLEAAEYAATHLHGHLVGDQKFITDPEAAMRQAYKTTDVKFLEKAKREGLRSGTTGVSVLVRESEICLGWLGDSQALLVCSGQPVQIMSPHKPEREDEKKRIEDLGGCVLFVGVWRVNGSISVSRAIGDIPYKPYVCSDADVTRITLTGEEEYLVLACDGLWDVLTPTQVTNIVYKHSKLSPGGINDIAVGLVNAARDSGSTDNISVIVVLFKSSLFPPKAASGSGALLGLNQVSEKNLEKLNSPQSRPYPKSPALNEKIKSKAKGKAQDGEKRAALLQESSFPNFHSSSVQPDNNSCCSNHCSTSTIFSAVDRTTCSASPQRPQSVLRTAPIATQI